MFNLNKNFKIKFLLIMWILLQSGDNFYCNGFSAKLTESGDTTKRPVAKFKQTLSTLNEKQQVECEDINTKPENHDTYDSCPQEVLCVPQIQCPAHVRMGVNEKPQECNLDDGKLGFCCMTGQNHTDIVHFNRARLATTSFMPPHVVEEARLRFANLMHQMELSTTIPGHPEFVHGMVFHSTPQEDVQNFHLANLAMEQIIATQVFAKEEHIPVDDIITNNMEVEFEKTPLADSCQPTLRCLDPFAKYRTFDGSCNNAHPSRSHWGSAGQPMERLLPPAYEDGVWSARQHSKDGSPLASAREISRTLMVDADFPHPKYNLLLMQFGQFLAHDLSQSAPVTLENGEFIQCCAPNGVTALPPERSHFACMPIEIEPNDDFYGIFGVGCMNFVRLSLAPNTQCRASYGKQRNKVTHFIDGSQVYGSSMEMAREMRAFKGGKLRMFNDFGRQLLPLTNDKHVCGSDVPGSTCFKSGDGRANQIISLIAIHILFAREHNRIADKLARLNPHATDELLFQEARRIVIAEMQHIIYNEYLPQIIGPMRMKRFRLTTKNRGYSSAYSDKVNPGVTSEFSGAAFRMGHSSVDGRFHIKQQHGKFDEIILIPDVMFNPSRMRKRTFYDDILKTMMAQPLQKIDSAITVGLSRFLFRGHSPFGLDLAAINIQRGRDHGLRSYNDYLELMGNPKIESFSQLASDIGLKLSQVYRSPDDIDLWVGGLLENVLDDGIVGSVFSEIIADQFSRLKLGDRYYYEYNKSINPGAFTIDQLNEIRKVTMARIVCDNADHLELEKVSPKAFVRSDLKGNQPLNCDSPRIPKVELEAWRF